MFASAVFFAVMWNILIDWYFIYLFKTHTFILAFKENTDCMIIYCMIWLLCHSVYYDYYKDGRMYLD